MDPSSQRVKFTWFNLNNPITGIMTLIVGGDCVPGTIKSQSVWAQTHFREKWKLEEVEMQSSDLQDLTWKSANQGNGSLSGLLLLAHFPLFGYKYLSNVFTFASQERKNLSYLVSENFFLSSILTSSFKFLHINSWSFFIHTCVCAFKYSMCFKIVSFYFLTFLQGFSGFSL